MCDDAFSSLFLPRSELKAALETAGKRVDIMWSSFVSPESYPTFFGMFLEVSRQVEGGQAGGGGGGGGRKTKVVRFVKMVGRQELGLVGGGVEAAGKVPERGGEGKKGVICRSELATLASPCGGYVAIVLSLQPVSSSSGEDGWATVVGRT
jgi:hypothetical protein